MRVAYHLVVALFSMGAIVAPTTAPNATGSAVDTADFPSGGIPDAVRNIAADLSARLQLGRANASTPAKDGGLSVGESLSESVEVHAIPKHETYRYAIVDGRRLIIDAASRKIVYVIR